MAFLNGRGVGMDGRVAGGGQEPDASESAKAELLECRGRLSGGMFVGQSCWWKIKAGGVGFPSLLPSLPSPG